MSKLYIENELFNLVNNQNNINSDFSLSCVELQNGYYNLYFPVNNNSNLYNVYYYNYDDLIGDYILSYEQQVNTLPSSCISNIENTDNVFYRKDITSILLCFFIIAIVCFYFPFKIFSRAFGRWLKV